MSVRSVDRQFRIVYRRFLTNYLSIEYPSGEPLEECRPHSRTTILGIALGTTTFGYSPVGSGEIPMERQSNLQCHCLESALRRRLADQNQCLTAGGIFVCPVYCFASQDSGGPQIPSGGSPMLTVL
ncbi:hypothetical protein HAX54_022340 [Datura stramonium]|uniref:Uncharacterized protein n=1 Tax=Datura stramonium TaxID=4076 RepID=A0ABS8UU32_DATST|nr:hypothetical protein [Datura stramonium]